MEVISPFVLTIKKVSPSAVLQNKQICLDEFMERLFTSVTSGMTNVSVNATLSVLKTEMINPSSP